MYDMNIHSSTKKILSEVTCSFSEGGILCLAVGILEIEQNDMGRNYIASTGDVLAKVTAKITLFVTGMLH
jgi:hypothetical protein